MNFPPFNTPIYRTVNNAIQTLIFKRVAGSTIYLEDEYGVTLKIPTSQYQNLCLSKRILLAELEESLRKQLDDVHAQMREMAIAFNPVDRYNVVKIPAGHSSVKEVHKYDRLTGKFIESYPSIRFAETLHTNTPGTSHISRACKGRRPTAYGYRWSYDRVDRLPASHSVIRSSISCKSSSEK